MKPVSFFALSVVMIFNLYNRSYSQAVLIDSLRNEVAQAADNAARCRALNMLAFAMMRVSLDSARHHAQTALNLALAGGGYVIEAGEAYHLIAVSFYKEGRTDSALRYLRLMKTEIDTRGDNFQYIEYYNTLGSVYNRRGEIQNAIQTYQDAIKKISSSFTGRDSARSIAAIHLNLGVVYIQLENYLDAKEEIKESLAYFEKVSDNQPVSIAYSNLSSVFLGLGELDSAISYQLKAIQIKRLLNDQFGLGNAYQNIGEIYILKESYSRAEQALQQSYDIFSRVNSSEGMAISLSNLASVYIKQNKLSTADSVINLSYKMMTELDKENKLIFKILLKYGKIKILLENYNQAIEAFEKAYALLPAIEVAQTDRKELLELSAQGYKKLGNKAKYREFKQLLAEMP